MNNQITVSSSLQYCDILRASMTMQHTHFDKVLKHVESFSDPIERLFVLAKIRRSCKGNTEWANSIDAVQRYLYGSI